jgi:hypothetical protein
MRDYVTEQTAGRLIGNAIRLYGDHFVTLFLIFAVPLVPFIVLEAYGNSVGSESLALTGLALQSLINVFTWGAMTVAVSDVCVGNRPSFRRSYAMLYRIIWRYLGLYVIVTVVLAVGFMLFVIPGLVLSVFLLFSITACIIERRGARDAIRRSVTLAKGQFWRVLGIFLLVVLIWFAVLMLIGATVGALGIDLERNVMAFNILFGLVSAAITPFIPIACILLYYDTRARKEHFDGAALAQQLMT